MKKFSGIMCAVLMCLCCFFACKAYDVKNNYYSSDFSSLNINAYVGGDAYNYIINGNYFTGYCVSSGSCLISAILFLGIGAILSDKKDETGNNEEIMKETQEELIEEETKETV